MAHSKEKLCDVAILFTPALSVKWFTRAVLFFPYFNDEFVLPSIRPEQYRANQGTPIAAYFDHISVLQDRYGSLNIPSLCFVDREDEVIDAEKLLQIVAIHNINQWKVVTLHKDYATVTHDERSLYQPLLHNSILLVLSNTY